MTEEKNQKILPSLQVLLSSHHTSILLPHYFNLSRKF